MYLLNSATINQKLQPSCVFLLYCSEIVITFFSTFIHSFLRSDLVKSKCLNRSCMCFWGRYKYVKFTRAPREYKANCRHHHHLKVLGK